MHRAILTQSSRNFWPSTYVQLRAIEHVGCKLPVVIYHPECDPPPACISERAKCLSTDKAIGEDASSFRQWHRSTILLNCGIREVFVLGSDVYPVRDPTPCFDDLTQPSIFVEEKPAIFWRDIPLGWQWEPIHYGLSEDTLHTTFTPQGDTILLDTLRCRKGIELANWFNRRGGYYFTFGCGDQTQWRAAWALLGWKQHCYSWEPVEWSRYTVFVHNGRDGLPLFVHRSACKFAAPGVFPNPLTRFDDLPMESEAFGFYADWLAFGT